jgi:hypothetical protein
LTITGNANLTFNRAAGSVFLGFGTDATPHLFIQQFNTNFYRFKIIVAGFIY